MAEPLSLAPLPEQASVSIVIPCRNEQGYIGRCLRSIEEADRGPDRVMVVICDGLSEDGTRQEIEAFTTRLPWMVMVDNVQRTTPHALNLGLRLHASDVGIILGAHSTIDKGFITGSMAALRRDLSVGCAGGVIINQYEDVRSRQIGSAMGDPFGVGGAHFRTGARSGHVDTVAFGAYRREVFERIGHFDEALVRNQDDEFNYRVIQAGFRILLDPAIRSTYFVRASFPRLYRQYHQYGYWKVYVNLKHRAVTTLRQLVPALWVLALFGGAALCAIVPQLLPLYFTGTALYLGAALFSASRACVKKSDILGIVRAFITLHLAYGMGYWRGILDFMLLRRGPDSRSTRTSR
jgi:GT2 family glycosyltransferase